MATKGRKREHDRAAIADMLLEELSEGKLIKNVCKRLGVHRRTLEKWAAEDEEFGRLYVRAREAQAHAIAEEALTIADSKAETAEAVGRNRLRVDTRKWLASKIAPRHYGERQTLEHEGALTVTHKQVWKIGDKEILF